MSLTTLVREPLQLEASDKERHEDFVAAKQACIDLNVKPFTAPTVEKFQRRLKRWHEWVSDSNTWLDVADWLAILIVIAWIAAAVGLVSQIVSWVTDSSLTWPTDLTSSGALGLVTFLLLRFIALTIEGRLNDERYGHVVWEERPIFLPHQGPRGAEPLLQKFTETHPEVALVIGELISGDHRLAWLVGVKAGHRNYFWLEASDKP